MGVVDVDVGAVTSLYTIVEVGCALVEREGLHEDDFTLAGILTAILMLRRQHKSGCLAWVGHWLIRHCWLILLHGELLHLVQLALVGCLRRLAVFLLHGMLCCSRCYFR